MNKFCQIFFNTKTKEEAERIVNALFEAKIIACSDSFVIDSRYCWNGESISETRYQVIAYSRFELRDKIISLIEEIHSDSVPAIVFSPFEANSSYLKWIEESLKTDRDD
jgi:uncharacterized protein involved in tolerance to divalent cations